MAEPLWKSRARVFEPEAWLTAFSAWFDREIGCQLSDLENIRLKSDILDRVQEPLDALTVIREEQPDA